MLRVENLYWGHYENNTFYRNSANSVGGVDVDYLLINCGTKDISEYTITLAPYNGAGRKHTDSMGKCEVTIAGYDLLRSGSHIKANSAKPCWYSTNIRAVNVESIKVIYTDGTTEECQGNYQPSPEEKKILTKAKAKYTTNLLIGVAAIITIFIVLIMVARDL
ncbi:MAG: hypothetical protein J6I55_03440 [Ruminococcus sp.]|nr:hypothetical protein [Ruminococcus sp.]